SCFTNCESLVDPSKRFTLTSTCQNCRSNQNISYRWTVDTTADMNLTEASLTDLSSTNLVVKENQMNEDQTYIFLLIVTKSSGIESTTRYHVNTNRPPYGGQCNITPDNGTAIETVFNINCTNWQSGIGISNYHLFIRRIDSHPLLASHPSGKMNVQLPAGDKTDNVLNLSVEIVDLFGASTIVDFSVQVNPVAYTTELYNELTEATTDKGGRLWNLADEGDIHALIPYVHTITSFLNVNETVDDPNEGLIQNRQKIRKSIAEVLSEMKIQHFEGVKQTADTLSPLLQKSSEITPQTQEFVLKTLTNVADFLENDKSELKKETPEKIQDITSGVVKAAGKLIHIASDDRKDESIKDEEIKQGVLNILKDVSPKLLIGKVPGEQPSRISSDTIALEVSKTEIGNLEREIETLDGRRLKIPANPFGDLASTNTSLIINSKMCTLTTNPFTNGATAKHVNAPVINLEFTTNNDDIIPVKDLPIGNEIEFFVPQITPPTTVLVNSTEFGRENFIRRRYEFVQNGPMIFQIKLPRNTTVKFIFWHGEDNGDIDSILTSKEITGNGGYSPPIIIQFSSFKFSFVTMVMEYGMTEEDILNGFDVPYFDIEVKTTTTGCIYYDQKILDWSDGGCRIGPLSNIKETHCLCNHLTWLSSFYVPPRKLNIQAQLLKLKNLEEYPAILATFCVIMGVSLVAMIWARRKDLTDTGCNEPTMLRSQSSRKGTTYHLAIYTGHRGGSGTTATPVLILSGEKEDSQPLILKNEQRKLFDRGSVETFVFTSEQDLGDLKYLTIWHDDVGANPSWFLSRITITNLNTSKQQQCFCNDWLAVDQSDGLISRVLPIASDSELKSFENIFLAKATQDLTDGHIWFSIIMRPARSNFSRVQRVACCLSLLLSTMLSNAMFFRVDETRTAGDEINVSGVAVRWSTIVIGIQSALIVLPINIFIVLLFRRAAPDTSVKDQPALRRISSGNELATHRNSVKQKSVIPRIILTDPSISSCSSAEEPPAIQNRQTVIFDLNRSSLFDNSAWHIRKKPEVLTDGSQDFYGDDFLPMERSISNQTVYHYHANSDEMIGEPKRVHWGSLEKFTYGEPFGINTPLLPPNFSTSKCRRLSTRDLISLPLYFSKSEPNLNHSYGRESQTDQLRQNSTPDIHEYTDSHIMNFNAHGIFLNQFTAESVYQRPGTNNRSGANNINPAAFGTSEHQNFAESTYDGLNMAVNLSAAESVYQRPRPIKQNSGNGVENPDLASLSTSAHQNFAESTYDGLNMAAIRARIPNQAGPHMAESIYQRPGIDNRSGANNINPAALGTSEHQNFTESTFGGLNMAANQFAAESVYSRPGPNKQSGVNNINPAALGTSEHQNFTESTYDGLNMAVNLSAAESVYSRPGPNKQSGVNNINPAALGTSEHQNFTESTYDGLNMAAIRARIPNQAGPHIATVVEESHHHLPPRFKTSFADKENESEQQLNRRIPKVRFISASHVDLRSEMTFEQVSRDYVMRKARFAHSDTSLSSQEMEAGTVVFQNPVSSQDIHLEEQTLEDCESKDLMDAEKISASKLQGLDGVIYLPRCVKYIAWALCFSVIVVAGFFTLLYGLSFGKNDQEKWLFAFFVSVFADICINQPIKVLLLASVLTLIFRRLNDELILTEIHNYRNIDFGNDRNSFHKLSLSAETAGAQPKRPKPPSKEYIEEMRTQRLYEQKMINIVIEIFTYTFYILLCLLITYGHRDPGAFQMTTNIEHIFYTGKFEKVNSIPKFWDWSQNVFSDGLFNDYWYNGEMTRRKGFLADGTSYLLGKARLRQIRVKEERCITNGMFGLNETNCGGHYDEDIEASSFIFNNGSNNGSQNGYQQYWNHNENDGDFSSVYDVSGRIATYAGSGFSVDLGKSKRETNKILNYLQKNQWLDEFTRAVVIDFTVYNTQSNFYCIVLFLMEVPANGGAFVYKRILSVRLDRYSTDFAVFLAVCEFSFLFLTIYYVVREIKKLRIMRMQYFKHWENWVEIISFGLILTSFCLLMIRLGIVSEIKSSYFNAPDTFINFDPAALSDQFYGVTLACLSFILFIKFLKLLRFNQKISLMFRTVACASEDTKNFSISFLVITSAFSQFAYLSFMAVLADYSTILYTIKSLFSMMLGGGSFEKLTDASPIKGKIFFLAYFSFMAFILLNMFISIINDAFAIVQEALHQKRNSYELIDFLTQRIKSFLPYSLTRRKSKAVQRDEKPVEIPSPESEAKEVGVDAAIESFIKGKLLKENPDLEASRNAKSVTIEGAVEAACEDQSSKGKPAPETDGKAFKVAHRRSSESRRRDRSTRKRFFHCKERIDRLEATLQSLDCAVDRLVERVETECREDEAEERVWRSILVLAYSKYSNQDR
uniref:Polycystic kidney disease protein 1-like 2 n=3 Tax=Clytia hemisphaerica TaxID=252671 RepID=A0A7M5V0L4_9CNID